MELVEELTSTTHRIENSQRHCAMKTFLSYSFHDEEFVQRVNYYLRSQSPLESYCYADEKRAGDWPNQVGDALDKSGAFVLFVGEEFGKTQALEARLTHERCSTPARLQGNPQPIQVLVVKLPRSTDWSKEAWAKTFERIDPIVPKATQLGEPPRIAEAEAQRVAQEICSRLGFGAAWRPDIGVPIGYPFAYEKDIIKEFVDGGGRLSGRRLEQGCPEYWPAVDKREAFGNNPVPEEKIGKYSEADSRVLVDVRSNLATDTAPPKTNTLTFAEARPRAQLRMPVPEHLALNGHRLRVGIVVSGGIAPGINSVIAGIVERHALYQQHYAQHYGGGRLAQGYNLEIHGYQNGLNSLGQNPPSTIPLANEMMKRTVREEASRGGSILGTSRMDSLLASSDPAERAKVFRTMVTNLQAAGIDILYVIGGDGSMRAAHALQVSARKLDYDLSVVAIPKTMDNDILWVWQSFGFLSAVEKAREFIMQLHTEASANPRLCVMQVFGSDSGFVVSHAALASGVVTLALIPELRFTMRKVSEYVCSKLYEAWRKGNPYGMVLMSETAIPTDWRD